MSSNLTVEPAERKKKALSTSLKLALQKRYGSPVNAEFGQGDQDYLRGLLDAGCEGAQVLIDEIEKHGIVHVQEEW